MTGEGYGIKICQLDNINSIIFWVLFSRDPQVLASRHS
jgi:hypothetical protein